MVGLPWGGGGGDQTPNPDLRLWCPVPPARLPHETRVWTLTWRLALTPSRDPASLTAQPIAVPPPPRSPPPPAHQARLASAAWQGRGKGGRETLGVVRCQLGLGCQGQRPGPRSHRPPGPPHPCPAAFPHPQKILPQSDPSRWRPSQLQTCWNPPGATWQIWTPSGEQSSCRKPRTEGAEEGGLNV